MSVRARDYSAMVDDAIEYLLNNTDITFMAQGGIARAFIDASLLEVARLQDFTTVNYENSVLSVANGPYLDLFGEAFRLPRRLATTARVYREDGSIRFYVKTGVLGDRLPDPKDRTKCLIPAATRIYTSDAAVQFVTNLDQSFPYNKKSVYVDAISVSAGSSGTVGPSLLTSHSLGSEVFVVNDLSITNGGDLETDSDYRFRLVNAFAARFSNNASSVSVAASTTPGVVRADLFQFARGAGTFDVLLVPRGNKLPRSIRQQAARNIDSVTAYGISSRVREPDYRPIKLTVRIRTSRGAPRGFRQSLGSQVQSAILNYIGNISIGGELIINQLRASILSVSRDIIDMTILELCIDGRPFAIRNYQLAEDELFVPDEEREAVTIL